MSGGEGALDKYWEALKADFRQKYNEIAADHMVFPRNSGEVIEHDAFGIINDEYDEIIAIWLKIDGGIITNASFSAEKCETCVACASMVTELARGKILADAAKITPENVLEDLGGLPEEYRHCAELATGVLRMAIEDYSVRRSQG